MAKNIKMKILSILGGANKGGAENFFERLSFAIEKRKNIKLELLIRKNNERYILLNRQINKIHQIKNFYFFNPFCHKRIEDIIEEFQPNIVLSWMNRASSFLPVSNGWVNIGRIGGYYKLKNYVNCDYIITNTEDLKEYVIESGWDPNKVEYIPNFVKNNESTKTLNKSVFKEIVCLSRFHRNKGIDILLKAMPYLKNFRLKVVGQGSEKNEYDKLIKKYSLEKNVTFYRWTNNISEFLNSADYLVCPSRHEPFGNIVIDGWAHKIPVIVSDTGGPGLLVKNNFNGIKFKNEDVFDLIDKIKFLDLNKVLQKKLIKNGYNNYKTKYSEQLIIDKYINFFEKIKCAE